MRRRYIFNGIAWLIIGNFCMVIGGDDKLPAYVAACLLLMGPVLQLLSFAAFIAYYDEVNASMDSKGEE